MTLRNHSRSTALKPSVIDYLVGEGQIEVLKRVLLARCFCSGSKHFVRFSGLMMSLTANSFNLQSQTMTKSNTGK